jgi:hypothetical protein
MAKVIFTQAAAELANRLIREMPEYLEPTLPVIAVVWSNGARDNHRGADGNVVWVVAEPPGWKAIAAPWGKAPQVPAAEPVTDINGLSVLIDPRARSALGALVVSAKDGALFVEHQAA